MQAVSLLKEASATIQGNGSPASLSGSASGDSGYNTATTDSESPEPGRVARILRDIEQDVERTVPGQWQLEDGADGVVKLRRILVAYSVHINRDIG